MKKILTLLMAGMVLNASKSLAVTTPTLTIVNHSSCQGFVCDNIRAHDAYSSTCGALGSVSFMIPAATTYTFTTVEDLNDDFSCGTTGMNFNKWNGVCGDTTGGGGWDWDRITFQINGNYFTVAPSSSCFHGIGATATYTPPPPVICGGTIYIVLMSVPGGYQIDITD